MDQVTITAAVAAFASDIPMRQFRHLVTQGYATPYSGPGRWGRYTAASLVVLAVAGRLSRYMTARDALAIARATIAPVVQPSADYHLTPPFILRATEGLTLAVSQTPDGPAGVLYLAIAPTDGLLTDVAEIAASVIERLEMVERFISPPQVSDGAARAGEQRSPARNRSGAQHKASRAARNLSSKSKGSNQ